MWVYNEGQDAPGESHCQSCGAEITWVRNISTGKRMPLDGHDLAWPRITRTGTGPHDGGQTDAALVELATRDQTEPMHVSHFSTCPQAKTWRGRNR